MKVRTTNITPMHVRNVTGCPSITVGGLVLKAKIGGKSTTINGKPATHAFASVETGHVDYDGYLIEGALPYWNIYANNSPGEWVANADYSMSFRLKRESSNKYYLSLGSFAGHDMDAAPPEIQSKIISGENGAKRTVTLRPSIGDYNWGRIPGVTHWKASEVNAQGQMVHETALTPIATKAANLSFSLTLAGTYTNALKIALCMSNGEQFCYLPIAGEIQYRIISRTIGTISVEWPGGRSMGTSMEVDFAGTRISSSVRKVASAPSKTLTLKSVEIQCTNQNGEIVYKQTRAPSTLDSPNPMDWADIGTGTMLTFMAYVPPEAWGTIEYLGCSVFARMHYG